MTAIKKYQRLESMGLWRQHDNPQRIEVVVSFGDATLLLTDLQNRPLTHWSLAAIEQVQKTKDGVIFSADPSASETLQIDDPLMIDAINQIRRSIDSTRAHPGQLRRFLGWGIWILVFIVLAFLMPGIIKRHAAQIMPEITAKAVGKDIQTAIVQTTGPICTSPAVKRILSKLNLRLKGPQDSRILLARLGMRNAISLPGGVMMINQELLRNSDDPAVLAGYILARRASQQDISDKQRMFGALSLIQALRFFATGAIEPSALQDYANTLLLHDVEPPDPTTLNLLFAIAEVPITPYAQHSNINLNSTAGDDPSLPPILSPRQMQLLQGTCLG